MKKPLDPFTRIANDLNETRMKLCAYLADEEETCDCKHGVDMTVDLRRDERNGCPELRELVKIYRNQAKNNV